MFNSQFIGSLQNYVKLPYEGIQYWQRDWIFVNFFVFLYNIAMKTSLSYWIFFCVNQRSVWVLNHPCRIYRTKIFLNLKSVRKYQIFGAKKIFMNNTSSVSIRIHKIFFYFFSYPSISPPCPFYISPSIDFESFIIFVHYFSEITIYLLNIYNNCFL